MKLSKEDLHHALWYTSRSTSDTFGQAAERLDNNTLEIEGYVRADHFADDSKKVSWTKFDPNDPKTFPKRREDVLFADRDSVALGYIDTCGTIYSWVKSPTHWRPLPKPPVETEVQK